MSIIKSLAVGNGDMFYIKHNSDNFSMIDCSLNEDNEEDIVKELKTESRGKDIVRFISTHPDDDHICGLVYLHKEMNIINFYCVDNEATKKEECWTEDFEQYCKLRDDPKKAFHIYRDCSRKWMNRGDEQHDSAGINILWPVTSNADYKEALELAAEGESPNNISIIMQYSVDEGAKVIWMGDMESDFQEKIKDEITLPSVDVLFAPHHGRVSGKVIPEWLDEMNPSLIIIGEAPSQYLNYYQGYNTITQNSAGDITFDCVDSKIHIYVSEYDYNVDFLDNERMPHSIGKYYIGTLQTKARQKTKAAGAR